MIGEIKGVTGMLLAGPDVAATLGPWLLATPREAFADGRLTVTASVLSRDPYLAAHARAFDLSLDLGPTSWLWRGVGVSALDAPTVIITASGAPEVRH